MSSSVAPESLLRVHPLHRRRRLTDIQFLDTTGLPDRESRWSRRRRASFREEAGPPPWLQSADDRRPLGINDSVETGMRSPASRCAEGRALAFIAC